MAIGTRGGTRTPDARLRTAALYPLSYAGKAATPTLRAMLAHTQGRSHPRGGEGG